jgi:hypothetical protein
MWEKEKNIVEVYQFNNYFINIKTYIIMECTLVVKFKKSYYVSLWFPIVHHCLCQSEIWI